ncbi:unnamed protein product [Trichogramma brassicae]|uniref:Reverse transcriptase domain-containing protein n=1 Tax=Trichogramma brassicae TaxID=86971 RepID=A0A6H5IZE8_9HYME|nr:unnamed protein product [Trichogramma brassicae]
MNTGYVFVGYQNLDYVQTKPTAVVFLDYAKAFDSIDHGLLLSKLWNMGIRGLSNKLLESYLKDRHQVVRVNSSKSLPACTNIGVPQGSILGPLLFVLFVNDLLQCQPDMIAYADDTAVVMSDNSWSELTCRLSRRLDEVYSWLYYNRLKLNIAKSAFIAFGKTRGSLPQSVNIYMNGTGLTRVSSARYLGVTFDEMMKWDLHINDVAKRTRYLLYIFYRLKMPNLTTAIKKQNISKKKISEIIGSNIIIKTPGTSTSNEISSNTTHPATTHNTNKIKIKHEKDATNIISKTNEKSVTPVHKMVDISNEKKETALKISNGESMQSTNTKTIEKDAMQCHQPAKADTDFESNSHEDHQQMETLDDHNDSVSDRYSWQCIQ